MVGKQKRQVKENTQDGPLSVLREFASHLEEDGTYREKVGQAEPVYYGIMDYEYVSASEDDYDVKMFMFDSDLGCDCEFRSCVDAVHEYLFGGECFDDDGESCEERISDVIYWSGFDGEETADEMMEHFVNDNYPEIEAESFLLDFELGKTMYFHRIAKLLPNRLFFTHDEAEAHLRKNKHHYSQEAHTYAMTAWRSPEVERVFKACRDIGRGGCAE